MRRNFEKCVLHQLAVTWSLPDLNLTKTNLQKSFGSNISLHEHFSPKMQKNYNCFFSSFKLVFMQNKLLEMFNQCLDQQFFPAVRYLVFFWGRNPDRPENKVPLVLPFFDIQTQISSKVPASIIPSRP